MAAARATRLAHQGRLGGTPGSLKFRVGITCPTEGPMHISARCEVGTRALVAHVLETITLGVVDSKGRL